MEQNQIIINEENREQEAHKYCDYTFKRYGIDEETQEAQLIRSAHIHGYNAGYEAARNEMREQMMRKALDAKVDTIKVEANADVVSYCVRYPVGQRNDNYESEVKVLVLKREA